MLTHLSISGWVTTLRTINRLQYICGHDFGKYWWIFNNFYVSGNRNKCSLQISYLFINFICDVTWRHFIFEQDSAPAHRTRNTIIELLQCTTPDFIVPDMWPPNSPDLNLVVCHSATCVWDQSWWHRWAVTASTAWVVQLGAVADWWCNWPMANTLACLCSCQRRTFWTYFVIINLFSLYLMNFMFHSMLDAADDVLSAL